MTRATSRGAGRAAERPLHTRMLGLVTSVAHTKVCSESGFLRGPASGARRTVSCRRARHVHRGKARRRCRRFGRTRRRPPPNLAPRHGRVKSARCVKKTRPARPVALLLWAIAGGGLNWRSPAAARAPHTTLNPHQGADRTRVRRGRLVALGEM